MFDILENQNLLTDNTKIIQKGRLCVTLVALSSLFIFYKEIHMQTYTVEEARRIAMNYAKQYDKNLNNQKYIIMLRRSISSESIPHTLDSAPYRCSCQM